MTPRKVLAPPPPQGLDHICKPTCKPPLSLEPTSGRSHSEEVQVLPGDSAWEAAGKTVV